MIRKVDPLIALPAVNMDRATKFYKQTLGLEMVFELKGGFYIFRGKEDGRLIGLHRHEGPLPKPDPDGVWVWLEVEEIAPVRMQLESQGVRFLSATAYLGPGYEAPFLDSEGNVLRLYEPLREVHRSIKIEATPAAVFAALTDARTIKKWFAAIHSVVLEPRLGGRIAFVDPLFGQVEGRVVELVSQKQIAFEFAQNWPTRLAFTLEAEGKSTRLEVHQTGFEAIRDRDFNIGSLIANLEVALEALGKHTQQAFTP